MKHASRIFLLLLLVGATLVGYAYRDQFDPHLLDGWVAQAGAVAPVLFVLVYALATLAFVPGSLLTVAGGVLFGPLAGGAWSLLGATAGAVLAFLAARHLAAPTVQQWLARDPGHLLARLAAGVAAEGWRFVAFCRLVPLFPFNLLNYAFGVTGIGLVPYTLATLVCMAPGALAFAFLGHAGRGAVSAQTDLITDGLVVLGMMATLSTLPRLIVRLRRQPLLTVVELRGRLAAHLGVVVDVRSCDEFTADPDHIAGALNIPLDELEGRLAELGDDPTTPIALVCRTDRRSVAAAELLTRLGWLDARAVQGGMTAWKAAA